MAKHIGLFIVALSLLFAATEAMQYDVGDSFGWTTPPNQTFYSDWARPKTFLAGDSLVFKWTGDHTVADVTMEDYNNCTSSSPFTGSPNGTEFMVTLDRPGRRYFICTVDNHCERGQKFSINVEWPFSAQPPSHDNSAPTLSYGVLPAFLSAIAVYYFFTRF
ncbi:hypothetical protein QN277_007004 [Acacia crassicarpa]|uniref:Phytocyanin domain-containing protein n=1 Tax=Acacia crassicarpa TaxID=499986 RepID=A0AAE1MEW0_9FABA|nr:hypothetical protein QN277_007004 [Acacia crassicarpa]